MASDYQKVAALLSLDIQVFAMSVASNPKYAKDSMAELEKRRLRITNDVDYRNMRYGAATSTFEIAFNSPDIEESGE